MSSKRNRRISTVLATLFGATMLSTAASAQVLNGGFESGLTSWTTGGVVQAQGSGMGITPQEGSSQALIASATDGTITPAVTAGSGLTAAALEAAIGLPSGTIATIPNGTPVLCSGMSQQFILAAGQSVSFDWNFITNQTFIDNTSLSIPPDPNNKDFAFAALVRVGFNTVITKLTDTQDGFINGIGPAGFLTNFATTQAACPFISSLDWRVRTFTVSFPGTYKLCFGVVHATNTPDNGVNSALVVDNVSATASAIAVTAPATVVGGQSFTGTVDIGSPVPPAQTVVITLSSNSANIVPPPTVTLLEGESTKDFSVTTVAVLSSANRLLFATRGGTTVSAPVRLIPVPKLSNLTLSPTTVLELGSSTATITLLTEAEPGGTVVTLSDNSTAITIPATATVPAGTLTTTFTVNTTTVAASTTRQVTATLNGTTKSASLTINPVLGFSVVPTTMQGGQNATGTVTIGTTSGSDTVITVTDNSSALITPPSVTILANQSSANFTIGSTVVASSVVRTVTVTMGAQTKTVSITLNP